MEENRNLNEEPLNEETKIEMIEADEKAKAKVNHILEPEFLRSIIRNKVTAILNVTVQQYDPVNVAKALEQLDPEDMLFFFKAVDSDISADVFTYLEQDSKEKVVQAFTSKELHSIVDEMAMDDLVDFVDELPANLIEKVLKAANPNDRAQVRAYLNFKEDTAGTLMTPEYLSVKENSTVKDCISKIRDIGQEMDTIWEIFVLNSTRQLVGTITLDVLLESDENELMSNVMTTDFVTVNANTDQENVYKAFRKYDVAVIPVVNVSQRMLGIITFDDALDIAEEETTEDMQISSAVLPSDTPYLKIGILKLVKSYAIWLVILLVLNTFTSMAMTYLQTPLNAIPILIAFLPTIMGTNGNASDQTATVTVRELALGNITIRNYYKAAFKELRAAFLTALILAVISFGWMLFEEYTGIVTITSTDIDVINTYYGGNYNLFYLSVSGLISITFLVTITLAKLLGISLPVFAKLIHLDPAVMSQPLISTILDIMSIVVFYLFSNLIMRGL